MEKGNFVYSGWRANGFVALVGLLVLYRFGMGCKPPFTYHKK